MIDSTSIVITSMRLTLGILISRQLVSNSQSVRERHRMEDGRTVSASKPLAEYNTEPLPPTPTTTNLPTPPPTTTTLPTTPPPLPPSFHPANHIFNGENADVVNPAGALA